MVLYSYTMRMDSPMDRQIILRLLTELGSRSAMVTSAELTLVGGAAGILTGLLPATRTTIDCDVIRTEPADRFEVLRSIALQIAGEQGLSEDWFSAQVAQLNVLPVGWQKRRIHVGDFGPLRVWSVGRLDLLAMKVYAGRMQDRADVIDMQPTADELAFTRRYLDQLRIPSREANLDQVQSALRFVAALGAGT
jgi:Nucleotidyltransferase of unknown function (DUF6036)